MFYKIYIVVSLAFIALHSNAQLCQGSLGDPVVDINFGAGANPGPPLPASTTNYQYTTGSCPNDGSYTITNSTSGCFDNSWFTLTSDHTGNANGYFMLVNASQTPSDFYLDTIHGLCPNTTFEFAAWILNIDVPSTCSGMPSLPKIIFYIENTSGSVIDSLETGNIPTSQIAQWIQYGFFFKTPPNVSDVIIRMTNTAPGGCGNDLALDDITFRPCGPLVTTSIAGSSSDTVSVCEGTTVNASFTSNISAGYAHPYFQWQKNISGNGWTDIAGATTDSLAVQLSNPANYQFRLAVADSGNIGIENCRVASNALGINIHSKPSNAIAFGGSDCLGKNLSLTASGGAQYLWSGPDNFSASGPVATINSLTMQNAGKYFVTVTSIYGCANTDSASVSVNPNPVANAGNDTTVCSGTEIFLTGSGGIKYVWQPATGLSSDTLANPAVNAADSIHYLLTVYNQFGCSDTAGVNINVAQAPAVVAGGNKIIIQGQSVQINATASGTDITYQWLPDAYISNPNILDPVVNPPHDTTYTIFVSSADGCPVAAASVFIKVYGNVIVPNAFSPNHDGINDTWNIIALNTYPGAEVSVFNRYGQTVFHSTNYTPWDGTMNGSPLPEGTYYYLIDLKANLPKLSGWIAILR